MTTEVLVPPLGANVDMLTLISWYKQEGDPVTKDEPLFVVQTDKATLDVEAPASGILRHVSALPGAEVMALSRIALIATPGEQIEDAAQQEHPLQPGGHSSSIASPNTSERQNRGAIGRTFVSPRAKRLAEMRQLDWQQLQGTGPEGAIVERDVLEALTAVSPVAISPIAKRMAAEAGVDWTRLSGSGVRGKVVREDVSQVIAAREKTDYLLSSDDAEARETLPVTGMRGRIAARMMQAVTTTAPVTLTSETDATELVALRKRLHADGIPVSYNDLLLSILARALSEHPCLNASIEGDVIKIWKRIDIGIAVDAEDGLRVPVLRDVGRKKLSEIGNETRALVESARQGKLSPDAMRGGTFTLTNLGMFGIDAFTPVINLPECAILGVGRIQAQPSVFEEQIVIRQKMWLSLTFDHRLVDGGPAARFLQRVAQFIEKPHLLLS